MKKGERKLKWENWRERNDVWWQPFKAYFLAGFVLLVLHHGYEYFIAYLANL